MLPSWIRSRNCSPRLVYFLAIEMTRRRFASTISFLDCRASRSPFWTMCTILRNSPISSPVSPASVCISWRCCLIVSLSLPTKPFQPLAESFDTRLSQSVLSILGEEAGTKEGEPEQGAATREEAEEKEQGENEFVPVQQRTIPAKAGAKEPAERSDDPVRLYLREMSSVELLSREGEIAIAKRIEAGREAMIAGLCESPLTFQAIIIWRDELNDAKILLRDIIDLEATYAGPDGKKAPKTDYSAPGAPPPPNPARDRMAPATAPQAPPEGFEGETPPSDAFDDEDDMENSVSLSAMEADLKPRVLETFDRIADAY